MNIFSNSKYLHNENGKICNVLGEKYILVGLEGLHTLVFLNSKVSYIFSRIGSPNRITESASTSWVLQDRNDTCELEKHLESIRFIWKNGTPVLLEDLEEGVPVNFDAIFWNGLGYQAILVWIGSKPKSAPVPKENELMFVKEFVYLPVHCFYFKKGQPTVYVTVEGGVKEIAFTHHVANVDGTQVSSFEELENICQNGKTAVATICKFIKIDLHNPVYIFVCSGLHIGNETCSRKTSMKSNFNCNSLYTFCQNQPVAAACNSATLHFDIDFHLSNNLNSCKHLAFHLNGKYIVIKKHEIFNFTKNYDVPYLGGTFHVYHEFKGKDVYNVLVFKTFPNQETLKDCVIDNKLNTVLSRDKNSGANELYLKSCSFIQNRIELNTHEQCSPSLKIQPDSNAESALSRSLAAVDFASELTLQLPNSISNSTIQSLPQTAGRSVGYADENFSLHIVKYENSPTIGASSQEQHKHNTEPLDPVFQSGRHYIRDLAHSMPNETKEKSFDFDLKNEQSSMPNDSKMFENSPKNDMSLTNSGLNWQFEILEANKPVLIKPETYVNSQMQHNLNSVDIPSQSNVNLSNYNSGKDKKEQLVLDCPQHPNSHLNPEKIESSFGDFQFKNELNNSKPNCDIPEFDNEFMSFLLEFVNILDRFTIEEFFSFMNSHKTTNTSFPCLRKLQGRVYYNEKLKQYFILGKSPFGICLFQILDLFSSCYFNKKFVFPSSKIVFNEKAVFFDAVLVNNQYISVLIYDKDPDGGSMMFSDNATHYFNVRGVYKGVDSKNGVKFDIFMNNFSTSISGKPIFIEDSSKKKANGLNFLLKDYVLLHLSSLVTECYNKWDILFIVPLKISSSKKIKLLTRVSNSMKKKLTQLKQIYGISPSTRINAHHGSYSDGSKLNLLIPKSEIETVPYSETKKNKLTPAKSNRELLILDNTINLEPNANIVNLDSGISESQLFKTNNLECKFNIKSNTVLSLPECNQEYILATASNGHKHTSEYLNTTLQANATLFSDENETLFNGKLNKKEVTETLKDSESCVENQLTTQSKTNIETSPVHDIDSSHYKAQELSNVIFSNNDAKKKKKKKKTKSKKTGKNKQSFVAATVKMDIPVSFGSVRWYPINRGEHSVEESEGSRQLIGGDNSFAAQQLYFPLFAAEDSVESEIHHDASQNANELVVLQDSLNSSILKPPQIHTTSRERRNATRRGRLQSQDVSIAITKDNQIPIEAPEFCSRAPFSYISEDNSVVPQSLMKKVEQMTIREPIVTKQPLTVDNHLELMISGSHDDVLNKMAYINGYPKKLVNPDKPNFVQNIVSSSGAAVPIAIYSGRLQYDRDFLLQLQQSPLSLKRPDSLPNLEALLDGPHQRV